VSSRRTRWLVLAALACASATCAQQRVIEVFPSLQQPPEALDFGDVPVLATAVQVLALTNTGPVPVTVSQFALMRADGVFQVPTEPLSIAPFATAQLELKFRPPALGVYQDRVQFVSDDPQLPQLFVTLSGVGATQAAAMVEPAEIAFGAVGECASALTSLSLISTGDASLEVTGIAFEKPTPAALSFVGSVTTPARVGPATAERVPRIQIAVRYAPLTGVLTPLRSAIVLQTNDPLRREIRVPVTGEVLAAPVASIAPLTVSAPGQRVILDGSASQDATPLRFEWSLTEQPAGAATQIQNADASVATLTLADDRFGAYRVKLDVVNLAGVRSCQPAQATVVAAPDEQLLVQLFWDNAGTDLDLHLLRTPQSAVFSLPDDCFFQNRRPDWGAPGADDDPRLERDALRGFGPEVLQYPKPISGTYRVVVDFKNDLLSQTPDSKATVRVYQYGVLKAELSKELRSKGEQWPALDIDWPSGTVQVLP
jgi:Abnormal spindle-like microcephaly-assoc'd, ASPM-SPD-2-Hydin